VAKAIDDWIEEQVMQLDDNKCAVLSLEYLPAACSYPLCSMLQVQLAFYILLSVMLLCFTQPSATSNVRGFISVR